MWPLPDPHAMYAIADRIGAHAERTRARAAALSAAMRSAGWHGRAAGVFFLHADGVPVALRASAGRLDDAADALRRHARATQQAIDTIRRLESLLLGTGVDVVALLEDGALDPQALLHDAGGLLADARALADDTGGALVGAVGDVVSGGGNLVSSVGHVLGIG